jgi:hypothetical protein
MTKFKEGTLAAKLAEEANGVAPIQVAEEGAKRAPKVNSVKATGCGTSKMQETSKRAQILAWIAAQPNKTATVWEIESHFDLNSRGYLQKLIEVGHLEVLP